MGRENGRSDRFKVDGPRGQHWNEREKMDDHSNLNWTVKVLSISGPSNWTGHIRSKYRSPFWPSILTEFAVQVISVRSSTIISSLKWPSSELKWTETNRTYFFPNHIRSDHWMAHFVTNRATGFWRKGSFDDWRKKPFITFFGELAVFEVLIFFYGLMPCCVCLRWVPKVVSTRKMTSSGGSASSIYFNSFPPSMMGFIGHVSTLSDPYHNRWLERFENSAHGTLPSHQVGKLE